MRLPGVNLALNTAAFALVLLDELLTLLAGPPPLEQPSTMWASVEDIPL